jgi:hypothetical protein
VTFRTPVEVQNGDWCALGQFWTAGALPQEYDMGPTVCAVRFAPAPPQDNEKANH